MAIEQCILVSKSTQKSLTLSAWRGEQITRWFQP